VIAAPPGVQVKVTITLELFHPAALGAGETVAVIDGGPTAVTLKLVENENELSVAVIDEIPVLAAVANPAALTVATAGFDEAHVTDEVISTVVPSEYLPVTINRCVEPVGTNGFCGLKVAVNNVGIVTVRVAEALTLPKLAVIVVLPWETAFTRPPELIVATADTEEFQLTLFVRSSVLLSA
jgi:hypothetical protein